MDQIEQTGQAGETIEVTEEMIEMGLSALQSSYDAEISMTTHRARVAVQDIYRQMQEKRLSGS